MQPNYPLVAKIAEELISNQLEMISAKAHLSHLPIEIFVKILYELELKDVLAVSAASKATRKSASIALSKFFYDHPKIGQGKHFIQNLIGLLQSDASHVYRLDLSAFEKIKSKDLEKICTVFPHIEEFRFPKHVKSKKIPLIKPLVKLKGLHCQSDQVTSLNVFPLEDLTQLETLSLDGSIKISKGWSQFQHLSHLKQLSLSSLPKNLNDFDQFGKLTSLETLILYQNLSKEQCQAFSSLTTLSQLTYLGFLRVSPELKPYVEKLSKLEQLDCSSIIDQCPAFYENLISLKVLNFEEDKISSTFLASLSRLSSLTKIAFNNVDEEFSLKSLQHLNVLTSLKKIAISCPLNQSKGPDEILLDGLFNLQKLHLTFEFLQDKHLEKIKDFIHLDDLSLEKCENLSDPTLNLLHGLTKLTKLSLKYCTTFTSQGLLQLTTLTNLKELELGECTFGQDVIPLFRSFNQLIKLGLDETTFAFTEVLKFSNLQTLKSMTARWTLLNSQDFNLISQFTNLQFLDFAYLRKGNARLSDALTANLRTLTQLTSLNLSQNRKLTDQTIQSLSELTNLKTLALNHLKITNTGVKFLSNLTNLECLELNETQIKGSEGIKHLVNLIKLEKLSIQCCEVSKLDLKSLKLKSHALILVEESVASVIIN